MLKAIALAGVFFFASSISTAAVPSVKAKSTRSVPKTPQPKGFCIPLGSHC